MSISSEITRLESAKASIKEAIITKGVAVPSGTTLDGFAALIADIMLSITTDTDTNITGLIKGNGSKVSVATVGEDYASPALPQTVTLTAAGWDADALTQTVSVTGVTATNVKVVAPNEANVDEYATCGVKATGEAAGTVTFTCSAVPEVDLLVNIAILG